MDARNRGKESNQKRPAGINADAAAVLGREAKIFSEKWQCGEEPAAWVLDRGDLGRLAPKTLRATAKEFSEATSDSPEGLHPRHFALVCDDALEVLGTVLLAVERLGLLPRKLRFMVFSLLAKPKKGFRQILDQPCVMRLYEKTRKKDLAQYMAETARGYYVFQKGQSCIDVVWRQVAFADGAVLRFLPVMGTSFTITSAWTFCGIGRVSVACQHRTLNYCTTFGEEPDS